jgi:hypothetical protein
MYDPFLLHNVLVSNKDNLFPGNNIWFFDVIDQFNIDQNSIVLKSFTA